MQKKNNTWLVRGRFWILLIPLLFLLIPTTSSWPYGYSYRKQVDISNTAGDQTNYQVDVDITEAVLNLTGLVGSWHFSEANPGTSCQDIKTWDPDASDGVYWINPQGIPFQVYCDMTTDGGGWMLLDNFVSSLGDTDPYGHAIGYSNIKGAADLATAGYAVYLTDYEHASYHKEAGYLQMFYSGAPSGYISKTLPSYADEVFVKWGNWYPGTAFLQIPGGSTVQTLSADYGAATYQGNYNSGDTINLVEAGIFWAGEIWVRGARGLSSTTADASGSGNNGLIYGVNRTTGVEGYGGEFDGVNDYISLSSSIPFNSHTFSCWVNLNSLTDSFIVGKAGDNDAYIHILDSTHVNVQSDDTGTLKSFTVPTISTGKWYFLTVIMDGGTTHIYLNGIESSSGGQAIAGTLTITQFGRYSSLSNYLNGIIDEVRIYNRSLSSTEINETFCIGAYMLNHSTSQSFAYPSWCDGNIKTYSYHWKDLNFENSSNERLNYWLEDDKKVWVKIPFLENNADTTIYMYYGNPSASSMSSGPNTFEVFDDFAGTAIDDTKFRYGGGPHSQNEYLMTGPSSSAWGTNYFYSKETFTRTDGLTFQGRMQTGTAGQNTMFGWQTSTGTHYNTMPHAFYVPDANTIYYYENGAGTATAHSFTDGVWYDVKIVLKTAGAKYYYKLTTTETWTLVAETSTRTETDLTVGFDHYGGYCYMDTWLVRKYASPEPTTFIGDEEERLSVKKPFNLFGINDLKFSGSSGLRVKK